MEIHVIKCVVFTVVKYYEYFKGVEAYVPILWQYRNRVNSGTQFMGFQ